MREIKFRAKHVHTGEWHYFRLVDLFGLKDSFRYSHWSQFTGLTDKNGKEVYEGDILETIMQPENEKVFWKIYWGTASSHNETIQAWCAETDGVGYWLDHGLQEQGEIIGNIYTHPGLKPNRDELANTNVPQYQAA